VSDDDREAPGEAAGVPGDDLDDAEIDRYARAIVRIVEKELPLDSDELRRSGNTYATAFQFLVLRRGQEYGLRLGQAAAGRALAMLGIEAHDTVGGPIAEIHERVCRETEPI
jgi:hypothetical protein